MKGIISVLASTLSLANLAGSVRAQTVDAADPLTAVHELVAADRDFATAAEGKDMPSALSAMFDDTIIMPLRDKGFVQGAAAVTDAIAEVDRDAGVHWRPVRGGISADGEHGFTFGYMTLVKVDGTELPLKYLSYWIRRPQGWRVVAYKRIARAPGDVPATMLAPSLPEQTNIHAPIDKASDSLAAAEKAFSDDAQIIGLKAAFRKYGREDAMNIYGGAGFTVGLDAVVAGFADSPAHSPIHWASDGVLVAGSGDLGVSWGYIRANDPAETRAPVPFFTIWRRDGPSGAWRYVAE